MYQPCFFIFLYLIQNYINILKTIAGFQNVMKTLCTEIFANKLLRLQNYHYNLFYSLYLNFFFFFFSETLPGNYTEKAPFEDICS